MSSTATEVLKKLKNDSAFYFRKALKIKDKNAEIIPFEANWSQKQLLSIIESHYTTYPDPKTRPTLYIIILKARQQGMSTATEGIYFKAVTLGLPNDKPHNKTAMIISFDEDSAKNISEMSERYYQFLPKVLKPMKRNSRGKGLLFENPTNNQEEFEKNAGLQSKFLIESANNPNAGSSYTLNYLHISELSKWAKPQETMTSLLQAVPKQNAIVIVESTANGFGDYFCELWFKAKQKENNFFPLFLPWHVHKEYTEKFFTDEERKAFEDSLNDKELELIELYGVTLEQLNWRRKTISDKLNGDELLFAQEYPANDIESFLHTGRPVFNSHALQQMLKECTPPKQVGNMTEVEGRVKFVPDRNGYIKVWKLPEEGEEYIISCDVAEGLEHGDYSVAQVINRKTLEQVATWRGHIDPDLYATEIERLARLYNRALVVIESNNHGLTTITVLKGKYRHLYRRRTVDKISNRAVETYGWQTTTKTKPLCIDALAETVREKTIIINDKQTIEEMLTFVRDAKGKMGGQGQHDDCVMSLAIGVQVNREIPFIEVEDYEPEYETGFGRTGY